MVDSRWATLRAFLVCALLAIVCVACGTVCESANEKIQDECRDEIARAHQGQQYSALPLGGGSEECTEREHCIAWCIKQADCESIAFVMATGGVQRDPNTATEGVGPLMECLGECDPRIYDPP